MHLAPHDSDKELALALGRGIRTPVEALRIVLEDLESGTTSLDAMPGASDLLGRVQKSVLEIEEFCRPAQIESMTCTAAEIVGGVRNAFEQRDRMRLMIAVETPDQAIDTDETLLVRSLVRLVENGLEASAGVVMLHVSTTEGGLAFAVVDHGPGGLDLARDKEPFHTTKRGRVGLGLTLAARDIARLGGRLVAESRPGSTRFLVAVDNSHKIEEAA